MEPNINFDNYNFDKRHYHWRKKPLMVRALVKSMGVVTPALVEVDLSRETYNKWLREDPEFKRACEDIDLYQGDFVETKLFEKISEGSEKSIMFYLKFKGHKMGYVQKTEQTNYNREIPIFPDRYKDEEE